MEPLPMSFSPQASTGATILELQIVSTCITAWRTIGLVWRALTCRIGYRREESPTRRRQEYKSRAIAKELTVTPFECVGRSNIA